MPLKLKKSQTPSESINRKDETEGPWGRINPERQSVVALRLYKQTSYSIEETYSYPYRVLSSWYWRGGAADEELRIEAGSDLITVKGRGLDRLVDALDRGMLEVLREIEGEMPHDTSGALWVSMINVMERTTESSNLVANP